MKKFALFAVSLMVCFAIILGRIGIFVFALVPAILLTVAVLISDALKLLRFSTPRGPPMEPADDVDKSCVLTLPESSLPEEFAVLISPFPPPFLKLRRSSTAGAPVSMTGFLEEG